MPISLKQILLEQSSNWIKPTIDDEKKDIERVASELDLDPSRIYNSIKRGKLISVTNQIWNHLEGNNARNVNSFSDIVNHIIKMQKKDPEYSKDWQSLKAAFKSHSPIEAPIIMKNGNQYHLISGNLRLMVSRALDKHPMAYVFIY